PLVRHWHKTGGADRRGAIISSIKQQNPISRRSNYRYSPLKEFRLLPTLQGGERSFKQSVI
ncbi:MAG: hypothetical protein ABJP82_20355, partial [Hyphomicrobiales bacterium]